MPLWSFIADAVCRRHVAAGRFGHYRLERSLLVRGAIDTAVHDWPATDHLLKVGRHYLLRMAADGARKHGTALSCLDEVGVPADLRLDQQVGVYVLLGVHGPCRPSPTVHDELLLFWWCRPRLLMMTLVMMVLTGGVCSES